MRHALIPPEQFVKNRNAGVDCHQKRRGHRNDSEYKNTRRRKDYRKKQKNRIDCAARADKHHAPSASANVENKRKRAAHNSAQKIEQHKFIRADFFFTNRSKNQKPEHIAEQMRPRTMHEHIRENLPIATRAQKQDWLQAVFHRHFVAAAAARKNERKHVRYNQNYRGVIKTVRKLFAKNSGHSYFSFEEGSPEAGATALRIVSSANVILFLPLFLETYKAWSACPTNSFAFFTGFESDM